MSNQKYERVDARPVKRFFVDMLTRDIELEDAILDLLDNCVDGILRIKSSMDDIAKDTPLDNSTPYEGFWAEITVTGDKFEIEDNCGGIPWSEHDRAFRMGRKGNTLGFDSTEPTLSVGAYGIGMKRAIFKLGSEALIWTQNGNDNYQIPISADWMVDEEAWDLDVNSVQLRREQDGTVISVTNLNTDVRERFVAEKFESSLIQKVESHYAVIIQKGFCVKINGHTVEPKPLLFKFAVNESSENSILPYIFKSNLKGVDIFVAVGLREPIPGVERLLDEQQSVQFSSDYAGWTVICNDRVVLYCNRDELTGWGTARIPRYHTQFIAISGVVEFRGDPKLLPTTTTKRGLNFSSALYQQVLDRMREGTRLFIDYTNRWKTREDEAKAQVSPVPTITYSTLKQQSESLSFASTRVGLEGFQYKPRLPKPASNSTDVRISFSREKEAVMELAEGLLPDFEELRDNEIPRRVGEAAFDFVYKQKVAEPKKPNANS